ncbi:MAG TPA: DUF368 domain-containing protein [Oscillospiraceae bacterium]|nr:DUF368 domain-containing protein [Oscillospiraceae bacterium]
MNNNSKRGFFYRMLCGAFLGISVIAPGVSGSIMAVMMGIYDELINIISNPFKNLKNNIIYAFPMGIGAGLSVLIFINILEFMFTNYPTPSYLLFISLIAGSIPTVLKEATKDGFKKRFLIGTLLALSFALSIGLLGKSDFSFGFGTFSLSDSKTAYFALCGGISGMTSMIPGMSVSMMLMMLGVYEPLLSAVSELTKFSNIPHNLFIVIPTGICFVIGIVILSNLTKIVFKKFRSLAYFMVLGFMSGSLISVFPGLPVGLSEWIISIIAVCIGIAVSVLFKKLGEKFNVSEQI